MLSKMKWLISSSGRIDNNRLPKDFFFAGPLVKEKKSKQYAGILNLHVSKDYLDYNYYKILLDEIDYVYCFPKIDDVFECLSNNLAENINKVAVNYIWGEAKFYVCFGTASSEFFDDLAKLIYRKINLPILKVETNEYCISNIEPCDFDELEKADATECFYIGLETFNKISEKKHKEKAQASISSLAVLIDNKDPRPPSSRETLEAFKNYAKTLGISVDVIDEFSDNNSNNYDALFLRRVNAYEFSLMCKEKDIPVIDETHSILRCNNKIYQHNLFVTHNISYPKSLNIRSENKIEDIERLFEYPIVIKVPHLSYSVGVFRCDNNVELRNLLSKLFKKYEFLLVQEFLISSFDWRVGILDGIVLYVCKYFLQTDYWKIINHNVDKQNHSANIERVSASHAPSKMLNLALTASNYLGRGLFGVDIKEIDGQFFVMEVNDCPDINIGDEIVRDETFIWEQLLHWFQRQ